MQIFEMINYSMMALATVFRQKPIGFFGSKVYCTMQRYLFPLTDSRQAKEKDLKFIESFFVEDPDEMVYSASTLKYAHWIGYRVTNCNLQLMIFIMN